MVHSQFESRAPPPSPVTTFTSCSANDDDRLGNFLQKTALVPDLVLPSNLFPREEVGGDPPQIDLAALVLSEHRAVSDLVRSAEERGCFQLVNHGIPPDVVSAIQQSVGDFFRLPVDRKMELSRSSEQKSGYEEFSAGNESPTVSEEFFWCSEEKEFVSSSMQKAWPEGCSNFGKQMERFCREAEGISSRILQMLQGRSGGGEETGPCEYGDQDVPGPVYCFYKHQFEGKIRRLQNSWDSDVLQLLVRLRSDFPHSVCAHFPTGSSEFRVYTKTGWSSFTPSEEAIVFTIGDQIQKLSKGKYKYVTGRSMSSRRQTGGGSSPSSSVALLFSRPHRYCSSIVGPVPEKKTITIKQQMKIAFFLLFICHFLKFFKRDMSTSLSSPCVCGGGGGGNFYVTSRSSFT